MGLWYRLEAFIFYEVMSERDKKAWQQIKADQERYARYLERKKRERAARKGYETQRKRNWRAANPESASRIRQANHAVEYAIQTGQLVRPRFCEDCGKECRPEAHHYKGYDRAHWLDVQWLCVFCHRKADAGDGL